MNKKENPQSKRENPRSSNPFESRHHRTQKAIALSASAENAQKHAEYVKWLADHAERMMDLQAVAGHLAKPKPKDVEPYFETQVPEPKNREQLCKDFFNCNVWDVEPVLLDELAAARASRDQNRIDEIRQIIRAASWMRHERTDSKVAMKTTREKAEQFQKHHEINHASLMEEGFEKEAAKIDPDLDGIKTVLEAIDGFHAIGKDAEPAIRYVEGAFENDWNEFLNTLKEEEAEWPKDPTILRDYKGKVGDLADRINAWRMIRDQLYFQRYEVNLSKIGQLHSEAAE